MYMAFVIHQDDEDHVSFYTRIDEEEVYVSTEHIQRGDSNTLNYFISQYMFPKITVCHKIKLLEDD